MIIGGRTIQKESSVLENGIVHKSRRGGRATVKSHDTRLAWLNYFGNQVLMNRENNHEYFHVVRSVPYH